MFFQKLFRVNGLFREQPTRNVPPVLFHILAKELEIKRIVYVPVKALSNVRVRIIELLFSTNYITE